jgi:amidohydrolase
MIIKRMAEMASDIAKAYGGDSTIDWQNNTIVTYNDPELTTKAISTLKMVAGADKVLGMKAVTGGEDFSFFQEKIPGVYFFLGGMTPGNSEPFPHHTPDFKIDDAGMLLGVKSLSQLALDYLNQ